MQQRRTTSSNNPGSLPLTTQDLSNKKQNRLRRTNTRKSKNYFTVGLITLLLVLVSTISLCYFFFSSNDEHSQRRRAAGREMLNNLHRYTKDRHHGNQDPREHYRQHRHERRRVAPEDEWQHYHANNEEFENRKNMMHFRPDMNADVNIDREELLKEGSGEHHHAIKEDQPVLNMKEYLQSISTFQNIKDTNFIGLYFASSWCKDSQPATNKLEETFAKSDKLLLPTNLEEKKELGMVYISSDRTQSEMEEYISKHNWMIQLSNTNKDDTSNTIKRIFHTCAKEEVANISSMDRKYGIPRLVILDREYSVITTDGVNDVLNDGVDCIKRWEDLKKVKDAARKGAPDTPNIVIH